MSTGEFLNIHPSELKFPFELRKQSSCTLQLTNKTNDYVAFKVKTTNPKKYTVRPNSGIISPGSSSSFTVTMQAPKEAPPSMQCKDKFLLQSVIAPNGATNKDTSPELFSKEDGKVVEEFRLRVVYIPANPPSPVPEGSEEGSSPRANNVEGGNQNATSVNGLTGSLEEPKEKPASAEELGFGNRSLDMAGTAEMGGSNLYHSIPRGGPLYLSNLVGSLTNPPSFKNHFLSELQDLRGELGQDFYDIGQDDLSVDELKIVTEEELVDKAFDIAFKDDEVTETIPEVSEERLDERTDSGKLSVTLNNAIPESSKSGISGACLDDTSCEPSGRSDANEGLCDIGKKKKGKNQKRQNNNKKRKRKRDNNQTSDKKRRRKRQKKVTVEESYIAKVKELVRIKEKQLEDKAAAKLHSFNGSCRSNDNATISSERPDRKTSLRSNKSTAKARISSSHEGQVLQPGKEVVLCVEVYHNKRTWQKTQEFLVLGRQLLTELRDKIYCLTDQLMERAGQHDTSGYFLIENVFCNDLRDTSAIDYSKPILDWLKDSKKEALEKWEYILSGRLQPRQKALVDNKKKEILPRFKAVRMQETQFCELNFRLGAEYLYCHQGDCKHTIVIRDMRLIHPEDVQDRFAYPLVTFQIKPRIRKCSVCQIFRAKLVTVDDKWAGENPCYFCDTCYYMLHYANESLLYPDFSVYDYHHDQI